MWDGGENTGILYVKNIYSVIENTKWPNTGWCIDFWKWWCPLKIKIFTSLTLKDKIRTWDFLQKKGWSSPNIFQLCFRGKETVYHIFAHCQFTRLVWDKVTRDNKLKMDWIGNSTSDCLDHSITSEKFYKILPPLVNWFIWLSRNCKFFENKIPSTSVVAFKALGLFQIWKDVYLDPKKK
jgi:hypothetical protein